MNSRKKHRISIFFLVLSTLLSLGLAEAILRFSKFLPEQVHHSEAWWELRWRNSRVHTDDKEIEDYKKIDRFDPVLGHTLIENLRSVNVLGGTINTNSMGVRGVREYPAQPLPGVTRIVSIGDSFTFGECVNDDQTFSAHLEKMISKSEVINLGVHGYGHDQQLLRFERIGTKLNPHIVILGFFKDDVVRNSIGFRDFMKPRFTLQDGQLSLTRPQVLSPDEVMSRPYSNLLMQLQILRDRWDQAWVEPNNEVTLRILFEIKRQVEAQGGHFAVVWIPRFRETMEQKTKTHVVYEKLCDSGVLCIDPRPKIREALLGETKPSQRFLCHFDGFIHQLVAEAIKLKVDQSGWLGSRN